MLDNLKDYLSRFPESQRVNRLREYLQWLVLRAIDERGWRKSLAFTGGTALRVVYGTERFSEDIDFSHVGPEPVDLQRMAHEIQRSLNRYGLDSRTHRLRCERAVGSFFLKFPGILKPLGLSPLEDQILSIKVEIDLRPPQGGYLAEYLFRDPFLFWITHYTCESLFSTKLHAFLFRSYVKGRDFYDLIYYLRKGERPILDLFRNATRQTHPDEHFLTEKSVFEAVVAKMRTMDIDHVRRDVRPFLLDPHEERFLNPETVMQLLRQGNYLA